MPMRRDLAPEHGAIVGRPLMIVRTLMIGAATAALLSAAPAATGFGETDEVALLEPGRLLGFICGGGRERGAQLRGRLQLAMAAGAPAGTSAPPPLLSGLDGVRYPISTRSAAAQRYFDQGMALTYGFNHDAAIRAFRAAQAVDPRCAMCFWGEAYAHGPNINAPMDPRANERTLAVLTRAMALRGQASSREQALTRTPTGRHSTRPMPRRWSRSRSDSRATTTSPCLRPRRRWTRSLGTIGKRTAAPRKAASVQPLRQSSACSREIRTIRRRSTSTST
jgi:hypothetical protein